MMIDCIGGGVCPVKDPDDYLHRTSRRRKTMYWRTITKDGPPTKSGRYIIAYYEYGKWQSKYTYYNATTRKWPDLTYFDIETLTHYMHIEDPIVEDENGREILDTGSGEGC